MYPGPRSKKVSLKVSTFSRPLVPGAGEHVADMLLAMLTS